MKNQIKGILILFLLVLLSTQNVESQITGNPVTINPDDGFEFSSFAKSTLIWPEGKQQVVELNITLRLIPENISKIYISVIAYVFIENIGGTPRQVDLEQTTPEIILSNTNRTVLLNQTLFPPDRADKFYLNITMLTGTSFDQTLRDQTIRFPDSGDILVDRDRLIPLVNLYGFPPSSFFGKFLPLYGLILAIMIIPGAYFSVTSLIQKSGRNPKKSTDGDEQIDD